MVHSTALEMLQAQAYVGSNPTSSATYRIRDSYVAGTLVCTQNFTFRKWDERC